MFAVKNREHVEKCRRLSNRTSTFYLESVTQFKCYKIV